MKYDYKKSKLWRTTLSDESSFHKQYKEEVLYLRTMLEASRDNSKQISSDIQNSQPELTMHDITHVDALWETASIICNVNTYLNPLEAFIYGCCTIFHDMGLSLSTYQKKTTELTDAPEYRDLLFQLAKDKGYKITENSSLESLPEDLKKIAFEIRLRQLHAKVSRELPRKSWNLKGEELHIISDQDIRKFLGVKIGILSESHWWSIDKIMNEFKDNVFSAAPVNLPSEWTINNVKIACLLRVADYINIDNRRAPDLLYASKNLSELSESHWNFQNKLNRPFLSENLLVFESIESFDIPDIKAWWLAYNTIKSINQEINEVNNLLVSLGCEELSCKGVKGIESSENLAHYIKTKDWVPINTQFKASNIKLMIERFGGEKLYGKNYFVPIRELIQNSIDAIKARKFYDTKFHGKIYIKYEENNCLTIEDNGIGMSRTTLLNFLLDFGKSYWSSSEMIIDHPGLISSGFTPNGKYGIGFFSTFMISANIKILTKSLKGKETIVLEFINGIESPPIFRRPNNKEERLDSGTKLVLKLREPDIISKIAEEFNIYNEEFKINEVLPQIIQNIVPASPVDIYTQVDNDKEVITIEGDDWMEISNGALLERLSGINLKLFEEDLALMKKKSQKDLQYIIDEFKILSNNISKVNIGGKIIGRATIVPTNEKSYKPNMSVKDIVQIMSLGDRENVNQFKNFHKGILTVDGLFENYGFPISGLWLGENTKLDRRNASLSFTNIDIMNWLEEQSQLIIKNQLLDEERKLYATALLYAYGVSNRSLPLLRSSEKMISYENFYSICIKTDHIFLHANYQDDNIKYLDYIYGVPTYKHKPAFSRITHHVISDTNEIYMEGFKGQLNPNREFQFTPSLDSLDYELTRNEIFNSIFMKKTIEVICKAWGFKFGEVDMIDLYETSYLKNPIPAFISSNHIEPVALIINPKKTNREVILKKYKNKVSEDGQKLFAKLHAKATS